MSNTKHTPGPWYEYDMGWSGQTAIAVKHANSNFLIVPAMNKGANARLIAAAPRMFDALKDVLGQLDLMPDDQGSISMFNTRQDGKPTKAAMAIRDGLRTMLQTIINDATTI